MHITPNAQLVINSRDRFRAYGPQPQSSSNPQPPITTSQPYNNFVLSNPGQNIVQGSIDKIQVAEVRFPYDIPNVVEQYTDSFVISYGTVTIPASALVSGRLYTIVNLGSPAVNWVAIGAPSATVGVQFLYNGVAITGTGGQVNYQYDMLVQISQGFYTGLELELELQTAIDAVCAAQSTPITGTDIPDIIYDPVGNNFQFNNVGTIDFQIQDTGLLKNGATGSGVNVTNYNATAPATLPKSLLSMMGFTPTNPNGGGAVQASFLLNANSEVKGGVAPLVFTDYIDIVSKALCGNVYITDGSTQPGGFRKDLLARVYISDETSSQTGYVYDASGNPMLTVVGTRPFVIHRQFKNAKIIPNNLLNSLNTIDIQLLSDQGVLIPINVSSQYQQPRNFQITLNVFETDRTNTVNVASSGYGNY